MYVMDGYSLKQSQNIIIQVKNKTIELEQKNTPGKKLNEIYIIAFTLSVGQLFSFVYMSKSCSVILV